jgi:uncharacterized protein (DUF885 family)
MADRIAPSTAPFTDLSERCLVAHYEAHPDLARVAGLRLYDARLPELGAGSLARRVRELDGFLAELRSLSPESLERLGEVERVEHRVLVGAAEHERFRITEQRVWNRDPVAWLDRLDVGDYLALDTAPLADRAAALARQLEGVPRFLDDAREQLDAELDATVVRVAIGLFDGFRSFLENELAEVFEEAHGGDLDYRRVLLQSRLSAAEAVRGFLGFLEGRLDAARPDAFAIGPDTFRRLLATGEGIDVDPDRLLELGRQDLERNREALVETAREIDPTASPRALVERLSSRHPAADEVVEVTRRGLDALRRFVVERDLVTVPSDTECRVRATPPYLAHALAMMDGPGALAEEEHAGIYSVTLPRPGWDATRTEEWLRGFCTPERTLTSIHEAWPGHFLQALHVRRCPSRVLRTFESYSAVEAWAHYAEEMMVEEGLGADDPALRLFQRKAALVRDVRLVASVEMHTRGMSVGRAADRFREEALLSPAGARAEAERVTFDPGVCNYTLGKLMLRKLRDDLRSRDPGSFSLRAFHDEFLAWAAIPVPWVRERLLGPGSGPPL